MGQIVATTREGVRASSWGVADSCTANPEAYRIIAAWKNKAHLLSAGRATEVAQGWGRHVLDDYQTK